MKRIVCTLVAVALLTACSPETPSADPSVPTTPASTAPATPTPSTSASLDPAKDPLYLEAEKVYRAYFEEMRKVEASGFASPEWPKAMDQYVTGRMKDVLAETIRESHEFEWRPMSGETSQLTAVAPNPGVQARGSIVSIRTCTDGRGVTLVRKSDGQPVKKGVLVYKEIYFKRFSGSLKGFTQSARRVDQCPIE